MELLICMSVIIPANGLGHCICGHYTLVRPSVTMCPEDTHIRNHRYSNIHKYIHEWYLLAVDSIPWITKYIIRLFCQVHTKSSTGKPAVPIFHFAIVPYGFSGIPTTSAWLAREVHASCDTRPQVPLCTLFSTIIVINTDWLNDATVAVARPHRSDALHRLYICISPQFQ